MYSPFFVTRVGLGLAALTVEETAKIPSKAVNAALSVPRIPVKLAGSALQKYMQINNTISDLAQRGDNVIHAVLAREQNKPDWAHFDEDDENYGDQAHGDQAEADIYGDSFVDIDPEHSPGSTPDEVHVDATGVASGAVRRRPDTRS